MKPQLQKILPSLGSILDKSLLMPLICTSMYPNATKHSITIETRSAFGICLKYPTFSSLFDISRNLKSKHFDEAWHGWTTSKVTDFSAMFYRSEISEERTSEIGTRRTGARFRTCVTRQSHSTMTYLMVYSFLICLLGQAPLI